VPTPFFHLSIAQDLLQCPALSGRALAFLESHRCAFLLGNTAPDVQVVSGQSRTATHFFDLPIRSGDPQPWEQLLALYPALGQPGRLEAAQAAFLAGYLCHLRADWDWVREIFIPIFGPACAWGNFRQRLYYHNVLRAYLDQRLLPSLQDGLDGCLGAVEPAGWLPFVADRHLRAWRDLLAPQFHPGAAAQTVEVFAARQGIPSAEYYALLNSEARLQTEIFSHLPYQEIIVYRQHLLLESARLVESYLSTAVRLARPVDASRGARVAAPARQNKESRP
jgi:hypothetical protein